MVILKMIRSLVTLRVLVNNSPQLTLAAQRLSLSTSSAPVEDVGKFIADVLATKKFSKQDIDNEVSKFQKANVKTMDLLRKLNMHDYEQTGVSVGAARAIQDALWELKHEEVVKKTETKMKLRRENSSKQESRQKRL